MKNKKKPQVRFRSGKMYNSGHAYLVRAKQPSEGLCKVDLEELKASLQKIERVYYSSNIKLERIKKQKTSEIVGMKLKSCKRLLTKSKS